MKTTFMANAQNIERKWYVIDAQGKALGRVAVEAAKLLRGKHKTTYTPHVDTGDFVIVINADKILLTGKKLQQKTLFRHSGYPGGTTFVVYEKLLQDNPERAMEVAVKGMLPHNRLGRQMYRKLKVYRGSEHPHEAQQPQVHEFSVR